MDFSIQTKISDLCKDINGLTGRAIPQMSGTECFDGEDIEVIIKAYNNEIVFIFNDDYAAELNDFLVASHIGKFEVTKGAKQLLYTNIRTIDIHNDACGTITINFFTHDGNDMAVYIANSSNNLNILKKYEALEKKCLVHTLNKM